jgi:hypothetical protein
MDAFGLAIAALLGFFAGGSLRGRASQKSETPQLCSLDLNAASDHELILRPLRRELANYVVRLDPDRYLQLYREARAVDIGIGREDRASQEAQLAVMTQKYPFYKDFDLIGTRDHVLYADAFKMYSLEDIEAHYLNMVKFHALQRALDPNWKFRDESTTDKDL